MKRQLFRNLCHVVILQCKGWVHVLMVSEIFFMYYYLHFTQKHLVKGLYGIQARNVYASTIWDKHQRYITQLIALFSYKIFKIFKSGQKTFFRTLCEHCVVYIIVMPFCIPTTRFLRNKRPFQKTALQQWKENDVFVFGHLTKHLQNNRL